MTRLIDLTDAKFKIQVNEAVVDYIGRANPFAHSDVGGKLIELAKGVAGAHAYSPDYRACAYVVLHSDANVIFAMASGMSSIAFRLPQAAAREASADRAAPCDIGKGWLAFDPFGRPSKPGEGVLVKWCLAACRYAQTLGSPPAMRR
jgi:hypothetical protein